MFTFLLLFWPLLWATAIGSGIYLAFRYVRTREQAVGASASLDALRERVSALEEEVSETRTELRRLEAGQQFTSALLMRSSTDR